MVIVNRGYTPKKHGQLNGFVYFLAIPDKFGWVSGFKLMGKIRVHNPGTNTFDVLLMFYGGCAGGGQALQFILSF